MNYKRKITFDSPESVSGLIQLISHVMGESIRHKWVNIQTTGLPVYFARRSIRYAGSPVCQSFLYCITIDLSDVHYCGSCNPAKVF